MKFLIILDDYHYNICAQEVEKVGKQPPKTNRSRKSHSYSQIMVRENSYIFTTELIWFICLILRCSGVILEPRCVLVTAGLKSGTRALICVYNLLNYLPNSYPFQISWFSSVCGAVGKVKYLLFS